MLSVSYQLGLLPNSQVQIEIHVFSAQRKHTWTDVRAFLLRGNSGVAMKWCARVCWNNHCCCTMFCSNRNFWFKINFVFFIVVERHYFNCFNAIFAYMNINAQLIVAMLLEPQPQPTCNIQVKVFRPDAIQLIILKRILVT